MGIGKIFQVGGGKSLKIKRFNNFIQPQSNREKIALKEAIANMKNRISSGDNFILSKSSNAKTNDVIDLHEYIIDKTTGNLLKEVHSRSDGKGLSYEVDWESLRKDGILKTTHYQEDGKTAKSVIEKTGEGEFLKATHFNNDGTVESVIDSGKSREDIPLSKVFPKFLKSYARHKFS